ncbi:MAG: AAA family ATPase [Lachnospiraceae bacterium]|nr:AAA family ATPase [Lachnospiraceae bacterium]
MKLKNIEWRNFKSYSNIPTTIDFDNKSSLNLIIGDNGTGKSSISEVITFALYGKIDNFNNSDIPNRINKNLYTKIEIDCNGHDIIIERGLSPNIFEVHIDGKLYDVAGKTNVQNMLEEVYFKIPYSVFRNTLVLSINDFKSLMNLGAADKRNIIDKIFGFNVYNLILKGVKEELKNLNSCIKYNEGSIETSRSYISNYNQKLEEISANEISQDDITELTNKIKEIEILITQKESLLQKCQELKKSLNGKVYDDSVEYKELDHKIKQIDEKINLINLGKCPTCGSSLESNIFKEEKEKLLKEREEHVEKQNTIRKGLKDIKSKLNAVDKKENSIKHEINKTNITELRYDLKYKTSINESNTEQIKKLKDDINLKLISLTDENNSLLKQKQILDVMTIIFGDDGIKKHMITKYIPQINGIVSNVLNFMNLNYNITFDGNFNNTITQNGYNIKYSTMSTGEKKRVDFACVISIIQFMKKTFGDVNLLFLDELFSNIDITGVSDMIDLLKKLSDELDLNIYLIHHAQLEDVIFDNILRTTKPDGFSRLTQTKE